MFRKKKILISEVSEFWILPYTQNRKLENLGNFLLRTFLEVYETQNLKTDWKMTQNKKRYFYDVIWEEKMPISEVSEFSILPYTWNRKLGNLGKF